MKIGLVFLPLSLCACAQNVRVYEPIAQHTLQAGADNESDVVWVQRFDSDSGHTRLLRCTNVQTGPKCDEAKMP